MAVANLLVGTWGGVFQLGKAGPNLMALGGNVITHLSIPASGAAAVAAVPVLGPVHTMYRAAGQAEGQQASGLHLLRPPSGAQDGAFSAHHVWRGDARACLAWDLAPPADGGGGQPAGALGLAVGTEPADVFASLDGGASWSAGADGFAAAATRGDWTFPAPPHQPHVLSLEALPAALASAPAAAQPQLVAGVEVGGVLVSGDASGSGGAWQERSQGLYADVHSCRVDPHNPRHWLVVTGRGLYASDDAGTSWRRQAEETWQKRYTVGLAFNPQQQGEVLVAAGDKPPAIGVHLYRSTDGGNSWQDITDAAFACPGCAEAKGERTPVPYFYQGKALLGTSTGHVLQAGDGERREWSVAARLPHPVTCMAAAGQSPSSVMH